MKILMVGGAVRDKLLGRTPNDMDFVVLGATVEEFMASYPQAKQVGNHFPVFLADGDEFAFARTEKKNGEGHTGFSVSSSPEVTLEDDLNRRDLTINAMAMCPESGALVCPDQSVDDLEHRVLRHTSDAFKDDPLRVFRVARFAAQLPDFTVAGATMLLMRTMADELMTLPAERVFKELKKALEAPAPHRFFEVLRDCGCLKLWFPEVADLIGVPAGPDEGKHKGEVDTFDHTMKALRLLPSTEPEHRFAVLCHDFGKAFSKEPPCHKGHDRFGVIPAQWLCERLRVPNSFRRSALVFTAQHIRMHRAQEMRAGKVVALLLQANREMHGGLAGFLKCSMADGMTLRQAVEIKLKGAVVIDARVPEAMRDRGKACAMILQQERCNAWAGRGA